MAYATSVSRCSRRWWDRRNQVMHLRHILLVVVILVSAETAAAQNTLVRLSLSSKPPRASAALLRVESCAPPQIPHCSSDAMAFRTVRSRLPSASGSRKNAICRLAQAPRDEYAIHDAVELAGGRVWKRARAIGGIRQHSRDGKCRARPIGRGRTSRFSCL